MPFVVNLRYTTALQRFNIHDLPKHGLASSDSGGKPWAAGIQAGYGFELWGKAQNIYLGYQASREAAGLLVPKDRWLLGYGIDLFGRDTIAAIEWDHDLGYSKGNGGNGNNTDLVTVRTGFKFA